MHTKLLYMLKVKKCVLYSKFNGKYIYLNNTITFALAKIIKIHLISLNFYNKNWTNYMPITYKNKILYYRIKNPYKIHYYQHIILRI